MRHPLLAALLILLALGCTDGNEGQEELVEMTTLEDVPTELKPIQNPPQIEFDQRAAPAETPEGEQPSSEETPTAEKVESGAWLEDLPFSPKIAMDPVDGSKISIRQDTPLAEFKGRIYYFSSEANRLQFIRNPEEYLSGAFSSY